MRLNLHSRLAQRVLVQLSHTPYRSENDLYEAAGAVAWEIWFTPSESFKIEVTAQHSPLKSLNFAALKIKDAVADRFRDKQRRAARRRHAAARRAHLRPPHQRHAPRSTSTPRASRCSSAAGARTRARRR